MADIKKTRHIVTLGNRLHDSSWHNSLYSCSGSQKLLRRCPPVSHFLKAFSYILLDLFSFWI